MNSKILFFPCVLALAGTMFAREREVPKDAPHLDHVWVIMMENHGYVQIVGNPNAPFANWYMKEANAATNYFAVGHPSSTNYLEVVGGSNFGVRSDNPPDWHDAACTRNLATPGIVNTDYPASPNVCPISGSGLDAETPPIDFTNECPNPSVQDPCPPGLFDVNGTIGYPPAETIGKSIADQLAERGRTWKSYQESLPPQGADGVNNSDGFFTSAASITAAMPNETQSLIDLYAVKHNPFAYFRSVQEGEIPGSSLKNVVGFAGPGGLYEDLGSGKVPTYSFIAPNQCNDQHGRGNAGPQCDFDPNDNGTQQGLNPALIYLGDSALRNIVNAIHNSPVWKRGHNAIVVLWDENDYSFKPIVNQVLTIVDTNFGSHGKSSNQFYTHFSLLKTIEGGLELPCLNHACDENMHTMSDFFGNGN